MTKYLCILFFSFAVFNSSEGADVSYKIQKLQKAASENKPYSFEAEVEITGLNKGDVSLNMDAKVLKLTKCTNNKFSCMKDDTTIHVKYDTDPVILEYEGQYELDGLQMVGNEFFYADFRNGDAKKVIPFPQGSDLKAFETKVNGELFINNFDKLSGKKSLTDIAFVKGKFHKIESDEQNNKITLYTDNPNIIDEKWGLPNVVNTFAENLKTLTGKEMGETHMFLLSHALATNINVPGLTAKKFQPFSLKDLFLCERSLYEHLSNHLFEGYKVAKDRWLNVGLAKYLSYYSLKQLSGNAKESLPINLIDDFVVDEVQLRALETDGSNQTLSLKGTSKTMYDDIQQDPIFFSKAAAVWHSLASICGENKFLGLLKTYAGKSGQDLSAVINSFKGCFDSTEKSKQFFERSYENSGYPVVHVKLIEPKNGQFNLKQEKFSWTASGLPDKKAAEDSRKPWGLHLEFVKSKDSRTMEWLGDLEKNYTVKTEKWFVVDNSKGYYRVNYDKGIWNEIMTKFENNSDMMTPINRAQIIDDVFSFARSVVKYTEPTPDYKMALEIFNHLKNEKHYIPLRAALNAFSFLDSALLGQPVHSYFRSQFKKTIGALYEKNPLKLDSGKEPPSLSDLLFKKELWTWACKLNVNNCTQVALQLFESWTENNHYDGFSYIIGCTAITHIPYTRILFERLLEMEKDIPTKMLYIDILGCLDKENDIQRFLDLGVKKHRDYFFEIFSSTLNGHPENVKTILSYLKKNKNEMVKTFNNGERKKMIELTLRKLSEKDGETVLNLIKDGFVSDESLKNRVASVVSTNKVWRETKLGKISDYYKSGEGRVKPIALIIAMSAIIPFVNHFL